MRDDRVERGEHRDDPDDDEPLGAGLQHDRRSGGTTDREATQEVGQRERRCREQHIGVAVRRERDEHDAEHREEHRDTHEDRERARVRAVEPVLGDDQPRDPDDEEHVHRARRELECERGRQGPDDPGHGVPRAPRISGGRVARRGPGIAGACTVGGLRPWHRSPVMSAATAVTHGPDAVGGPGSVSPRFGGRGDPGRGKSVRDRR